MQYKMMKISRKGALKVKKVVFGIFIAVVLAAAGAFFYVTNIDWNEHKDKIAQQFYNMTGKEIVFEGRLNFKVFPSPYLNAVHAKIYNSDNHDEKPLVEVKNLVAELSLTSLLHREFNVTKMVLDGAVVNIDWNSERLNWQGDLSPDQRQIMEDSGMVLNSVSLKNAEVNFESSQSGQKWTLENLNGEISAQSVFGPFRIEGNYLNGNSTEGFAITIGKLSESFATTLNGVVSHRKSDSYMRFDGSFQLNNKVLNGNVIVESQKLSDFVNANNEKIKLPPEYNFPMALGFDIALNEQNLALSNVVVKYGETQGAGELQLPLETEGRPELTLDFNFSNLELEPAVKFVRDFLDKYKEGHYKPVSDVDFSASVKAVRATYDGQNFKNLQTDFSFDEDTFLLNNFNIILPGDTQFQVKGSLYPVDEEVYYQADVSANTNDFMRTLQWLKMEPKASAASTYKKMNATAKIAGNFEKVQISPYKLMLDKSTFSGEAGLVIGKRKDVMLVVKADTVNFDNYISSLPDEEKKKNWVERMKYRFGKLSVLNDFDMVLDAKADLLIYEGMPFEKVDFKGNILNGVMDIEQAKIGQIANTAVGIKGKISGFGSVPQMDMLQYDLKTNDLSSLINKLELQAPDLDYKRLNNLVMTGVINGSADNFGLNTSFSTEQLNASYQGQIFKENQKVAYKGHFEFKYPDFSRLLSSLKVPYTPGGQSLGVVQFKADVAGRSSNFALNQLDANIGYSNISGNFEYDGEGERPNIMTQLKINRFEIDKFLPQKSEGSLLDLKTDDKVTFLAKPFLSKEKIDYSPYIYADIKGHFDVAELSYKSDVFNNAKFVLELSQGIADVKDFQAEFHNTPVLGALTLRMTDRPSVQIQGIIENANVNDFTPGGVVYHLKDGTFSAKFDFDSAADSVFSFISNLKGKAELKASQTQVAGIGLSEIYNDLIKRDTSEGLVDFVKENIGKGYTDFNKVEGRFIFEDQKYSLSDVHMEAPNTLVQAYGEGSLTDWTMNVTFNVKHDEPKFIPEYSFSLKNGMDQPTVDVNVSSLFNLYQSRAKQQEEARVAEEEAEKQYWEAQIKEQQKTANDLVESTRTHLESQIDAKIAEAVSSENANRYAAVKQEMNRILAEIIEKTASANPEEADDTLLNQLKESNKNALSEIEGLEQKTKEIYLDDLKRKNEVFYHKVVDAHNNLKKNIFSYNTQIDKYNERLANIITDYTLKDDENFQKEKKLIDDKIKKLEWLNAETERARRFKISDATVETYESYNKELDEVYQTLSEGAKELSAAAKKLDDMMMPKIADAEKAYHQMRENEENERRIRENTGHISIKKTGKTLEIVRDLEEIKTAEQEISNEEVKVLDFSRKKIEETSQEQKSTGNVIKKARNIR